MDAKREGSVTGYAHTQTGHVRQKRQATATAIMPLSFRFVFSSSLMKKERKRGKQKSYSGTRDSFTGTEDGERETAGNRGLIESEGMIYVSVDVFFCPPSLSHLLVR